jgi:hypothetical protein
MLSKTDINGTALRILTLACYFLPFIFFFSTCVDGVSKSAYNKSDAIANEREKIEFEKKDLLSKASDLITNNVSVTDSSAQLSSETMKILERAGDDWYLAPTFTSLSALGMAMQFPNAVGQVLVVISFLLAFLTLVLWRWLKRKIGFYFITLNLFLVGVLIIICFMESVTVLYGLWGLLFLLFVQLLSELQKRKKIMPNLEGINPN